MKILEKLSNLVSGKYSAYKRFRKELGYLDPTAHIDMPETCSCPSKIFLYKNAIVRSQSRFIITKRGELGKFIMKENSGAAVGLTVITGNHDFSVLGKNVLSAGRESDIDKDLIVHEDAWIGANVTLTCGTELGRGCVVAAGSVVLGQKIPPYAIVAGVPAKVIGFRFTPEEIIEHEKILYGESDRISSELLEKNYEKYFLKRIKEIKEFTRL